MAKKFVNRFRRNMAASDALMDKLAEVNRADIRTVEKETKPLPDGKANSTSDGQKVAGG